MLITPIIDKIIEYDGLYYGINKAEETIFVTEYSEIASMYYAVPGVLKQQAEVIASLTQQLKDLSEEYNSMVMGIIPSGSSLLH